MQILEWWPTKLVTENILNWLNEASALLCTLDGYNMSGWYPCYDRVVARCGCSVVGGGTWGEVGG